jgi:hypothetical protein
MYLLSLDASTSEIGYCIWNKEKSNLIFAGHLSQPDGTLLQKALFFANHLKKILITYPTIDEVVIEKAYEAMFGGSSSAKTTTILNKINFCYQYICYNQNLTVHELSVSDCRKFAYPGVSFGKDKDQQKAIAFNLVKLEMGDSYFAKRKLTRDCKAGKKGEEVYEDWCSDITDSYIVGKSFLNLIKLGLTPEEIVQQKEQVKKDKKAKKKQKLDFKIIK